MNSNQALAKSYSKMMKSIGEDLKNVGPLSSKKHYHHKRGASSKVMLSSRGLSAAGGRDPTSSDMLSVTSANQLGGVTALVGMPTRVPTTSYGQRNTSNSPIFGGPVQKMSRP